MTACAKQFREMKKLKLSILFQNLEPDTAQKEEFMRLFSCSVIEHDGCHCHGKERVLELRNVQAEKKPTVKLPKDLSQPSIPWTTGLQLTPDWCSKFWPVARPPNNSIQMSLTKRWFVAKITSCRFTSATHRIDTSKVIDQMISHSAF